MKKLLILDNYDSFTYNLVQLIEKVSEIPFEVYRNDEISIQGIERFDKILLSPGPGIPNEAGILKDVIKTFGSKKSILGVCLGLQAIGEVYGGELENLEHPYHGIATPIQIIKPDSIFTNCPSTFLGGRYHSWVVSKKALPETLEIIASESDGHIMAMRHKTYDVRGLQFHPESILSEYGETIIRNWLQS